MDVINAMLERASSYYEEHKSEIESSERYDGSYYILKQLYNALVENTNAIGLTMTIRSDEESIRHKRGIRYIELCRDSIVRAIIEVIDSEFEDKISRLEDETLRLRHDIDE